MVLMELQYSGRASLSTMEVEEVLGREKEATTARVPGARYARIGVMRLATVAAAMIMTTVPPTPRPHPPPMSRRTGFWTPVRRTT